LAETLTPLHNTITSIKALLAAFFLCVASLSFAGDRPFAKDTVPSKESLRYPLVDRRGDAFNYPKSNNPFDLNKPGSITDSIVYDPATKRYYIYEKIGRSWYRKPTYTKAVSRKKNIFNAG
jgi:hypothetical protein